MDHVIHPRSNVTWTEALGTVFLATMVCVIAALLLALTEFYYGFSAFWFCLVVATAHFSLVKVSVLVVATAHFSLVKVSVLVGGVSV